MRLLIQHRSRYHYPSPATLGALGIPARYVCGWKGFDPANGGGAEPLEVVVTVEEEG